MANYIKHFLVGLDGETLSHCYKVRHRCFVHIKSILRIAEVKLTTISLRPKHGPTKARVCIKIAEQM